MWADKTALIMLWVTLAVPAAAVELPTPEKQTENRMDGTGLHATEQKVDTENPDWHYGGFIDLGYSLDFNFPVNHQFRSRNTTPRVNELDLNMAGAYVRKDATEQSRWGMELMGHGGQDALNFGFAVNEPKVAAADQLRYFGRANLSYLAPVGTGLTIQGGLFNSFIGYDSLYAKDNLTYTRAWGAEYSPYLMFGINATYAFTQQLTGALFVINGYAHLSDPNHVPSYGGQLAYKATPSLTIKETIYYGSDQAETSLEFWRLFSDSIVEWKDGPFAVALDYQIGTERVATAPGSPRAFWTHAALPMRWNVHGPWSLALRPEFYWDRNGIMTGHEQFIRTLTTTVEYRMPFRWTNTILRMEYRYDESTGAGGGFFTDSETNPGVVGLTPVQQTLIFSAIWTFDSP
jgi:hypothetical protein